MRKARRLEQCCAVVELGIRKILYDLFNEVFNELFREQSVVSMKFMESIQCRWRYRLGGCSKEAQVSSIWLGIVKALRLLQLGLLKGFAIVER